MTVAGKRHGSTETGTRIVLSSQKVEGSMRMARQKHRGTIFRWLVLTFGLLALSNMERVGLRQMGSARLVSIEELPEIGESCELPATAPSNVAAPEEDNLLSALRETPVHAQDSGGTVEVRRPPVRDILDTAPIYSSVGVDPQRDEVLLQDSNTWSIRVFNRLDNARPGEPPTEARRVISGPKSDVQFNVVSGLTPRMVTSIRWKTISATRSWCFLTKREETSNPHAS